MGLLHGEERGRRPVSEVVRVTVARPSSAAAAVRPGVRGGVRSSPARPEHRANSDGAGAIPGPVREAPAGAGTGRPIRVVPPQSMRHVRSTAPVVARNPRLAPPDT
ncbi:MAG: hypothetical protein ACREQ5_18360 [Candidatus Dormibacteria bacterium]